MIYDDSELMPFVKQALAPLEGKNFAFAQAVLRRALYKLEFASRVDLKSNNGLDSPVASLQGISGGSI